MSIQRAIKGLHERINVARNLPAISYTRDGVLGLRNVYLQWVEGTESLLLNLTYDPDVLSMLHTVRYWHIREADTDTVRPWPLVEAERNVQVAMLEDLEKDLKQRVNRLKSAPGHITVLDTNVLLHCQPPAQVDWITVLKQPLVRLVIPLRVIEELDEKKYTARSGLADRARSRLSQLASQLGRGGLPGEIRPRVTIEVPVDPGPRRRQVDADAEVPDTCRELSQLTGDPVTLISSDTGMCIRAEALGITVASMPEIYQLKPGQGTV